MAQSHARHLAQFLGLRKLEDVGDATDWDHETDRERYSVDGIVYDVETVQVRSGGEVEPVQKVYIVVPVDADARDLGPDGVCPTCGRPRARAFRRYEAEDAGMGRRIHEEHHA